MQVETSFQDYRLKRHFGSLDGVRFACIAAVLWHHAPILSSFEWHPILSRGFLGVNMFFVLSGFLITTLLLREEGQFGGVSLRGFYARRLLRIVPAYFLLVAAVSVYYCWVKAEAHWLPLVPYYFAFLANFLREDIPMLAPTWSLAVEEQYYLIWPAVLCVTTGRGVALRFWLLSIMIGLFVAFEAGFLSDVLPPALSNDHAVFRLPCEGYSAILMGSMLALMLHVPRGFRLAFPLCGRRWSPVIWAVGIVVLLASHDGALEGIPVFLVHALMAGLLASVVMREDHSVAAILRSRVLSRIGQISYGVYLFHLVALHFAWVIGRHLTAEGGLQAWIVNILYFVLSVIIAECSFRFYESPFLAWKKRFDAVAVNKKV